MKDHKISFNKHCPCVQKECPIKGNCVLCIQSHNDQKTHLPECMEIIMRPEVAKLAKLVEYNISEGHHTPEFWETFDKESFLDSVIKRQE